MTVGQRQLATQVDEKADNKAPAAIIIEIDDGDGEIIGKNARF